MLRLATFPRYLGAALMLLCLSMLASCGLFGDDDTPTFDEAFPVTAVPADLATTAPEAPLPTATAAAAEIAPGEPTAVPAPTATPLPTWQAVEVADGVTFELPGTWLVTDDPAAVDAEMESPETKQGLSDAGVSGPMDLFGVKVRALADGPDGERMFYVTIGASPFPTRGLLSALGEPLVSQFGINVNNKQDIETELGTALRVEAELEGTDYLAWIWIENAKGRVIILTTLDSDIERQLVTTLTEG